MKVLANINQDICEQNPQVRNQFKYSLKISVIGCK